MSYKIYAGVTVEVTDDGYMTEPTVWTKEIAVEIAREEEIVLTSKHLAIMEFLRKKYAKGDEPSLRSINHSGIIDVKTFYQLFPKAPLKKATKIAGLPKPSNCV